MNGSAPAPSDCKCRLVLSTSHTGRRHIEKQQGRPRPARSPLLPSVSLSPPWCADMLRHSSASACCAVPSASFLVLTRCRQGLPILSATLVGGSRKAHWPTLWESQHQPEFTPHCAGDRKLLENVGQGLGRGKHRQGVRVLCGSPLLVWWTGVSMPGISMRRSRRRLHSRASAAATPLGFPGIIQARRTGRRISTSATSMATTRRRGVRTSPAAAAVVAVGDARGVRLGGRQMGP